jgi:hypothetical protein
VSGQARSGAEALASPGRRRPGRLGRILGSLVLLILLAAFAERRPQERAAASARPAGPATPGFGPPARAGDRHHPSAAAPDRTPDQRDVDRMNRSERILALRAALIVLVLAVYVVVEIRFL